MNDLSPDERKEMQTLIKEAQELEQDDPENKYRVRGPPWNMEIRKISRDLSPDERKELQKLVKEAKELKEDDPENKYRVIGMEIRKISK